MISLVLTLQACSEQQTITKSKQPLVVQLQTVEAASKEAIYEFPATVSAVKNVDIKFEVSGRLIATDLVEGSQVAKGQLLAKIDPKPFERKVKENKVRHELAIRDLDRIAKMNKKGAASQSMLDNATTQFEITKLELANAKQDLSYTEVTAPFDAFVARRLIENNSYIRAGDTVANLQDRSKLYFTFDVPERLVTQNAGNTDIEAVAYVIGRPEQMFKIHYVEHQTSPDPVTQTYPVTFAIDNNDEFFLTPGARAIAKITLKQNHIDGFVIPVSALVGQKSGGFSVWLFNQETQMLTQQAVDVVEMFDDYVLIRSGVTTGDKVVSAAANQMSEGIVVKEYKADF